MIVGVLSKKLVKTPISFYNKKAFFSSLIKLDTELKEGQQMKRRRFCFLLLLLLILTSCRMQAFRPTDLERSTVNLTQGSIEGRIKEETIQTIHEPLTLLFENLTADEYYYGVPFTLEVWLEDSWYQVPFDEPVSFIEIAFLLEANATTEEGISLATYFDELPPGTYRIMKVFQTENRTVTIAPTFEIIEP